MKRFTSPTQKIGLMGEEIAVKFLTNKGFLVVDRNYTKKFGEIDVVAKMGQMLHFIEVKTIVDNNVSRETYKNVEKYSPFQNVTYFKLRKISRVISCYLLEKRVSRETLWVIDVISVIVSRETRSAKVEVLWNVIT